MFFVFPEKNFLLFPLKILEASCNLSEADFPWELCSENNRRTGVVSVVQKADAVIFRESAGEVEETAEGKRRGTETRKGCP